MKCLLLACAAALGLAVPALAACPDVPTVARFAGALLDRGSPRPFGVTTMAEARCAQHRLVAVLAQPWGDVPGPALAAEAVPPLRGALFHASLRAVSGAVIEIGYAARPAIAPGIVVTIGEDSRPAAASPYLALLDLAALPGGDDPLTRVAGNLGLRLGVVGPEAALPAEPPEALLQSDGSTIAALPRLGLAAPPAELVAGLARDLAEEGSSLRPGMRVALLAAPAPIAPRAGETWRLSAPGLGAVVVTFR